MKKVLNIFLALACIAFFSSCTKDVELSPEEMLTGGSSKSWRTYSNTVNGEEVEVPECAKDAKLTFILENKEFIPSEVNTCSNVDEFSYQDATWELSESKQLTLSSTIVGSFGDQTFEIPTIVLYQVLELSENKLTLELINYDDYQGGAENTIFYMEPVK